MDYPKYGFNMYFMENMLDNFCVSIHCSVCVCATDVSNRVPQQQREALHRGARNPGDAVPGRCGRV